MKHIIVTTLLCIGGLGFSAAIQAKPLTWCVYDLGGAQGDVIQLMRDYVLAAKQWGVEIEPKVYLNDEQAVLDFKNKKCSGVVASSFATKSINNFIASLGAVGLIQNNQVARSVFLSLASPHLAHFMRHNGTEVVGWIPVGSAYFMVKDRSLNKITDLAGLRLAVLKYDASQERMAQRVGARPVKVSFEDAGPKFLNGEVDVLAAPIYAYQPLELNKAIERQGGVINFPAVYIALDLIVQQDSVPKDFGQKSRNWFKARTQKMMQQVIQWESTLPDKYWYNIPETERRGYQRIVAQMRKEFVANGVYNVSMIRLVERIQCSLEPNYFGCKSK